MIIIPGQIAPQTIAAEIQDELAVYTGRARLIEKSSAEFIDVMQKIEKLRNADPEEAGNLHGIALHLTGDLEGALASLPSFEAKGCKLAALVIMTNLGAYTLAQKRYAEWCCPRGNAFSGYARFGWPIGAYRKFASFASEAISLRMASANGLPMEEIMLIDRSMEKFGLTDNDVGLALEAAHSILVKYRVMFLDTGPKIDVLDVPGQASMLHLTYKVPVSPKIAVKMCDDFTEHMVNHDIDLPPHLHISFAGSRAWQ